MEHPRLPELPILGTLASDVSNYYTEQAAIDNKLRLKALREREKETQMGIWDGAEYMNEVNWPEKKLKQGYQIEICFRVLMRTRRIGICGAAELLQESREGMTIR